MLSVIKVNAVMLSVVAPYNQQDSVFSFFLSRSNFLEDLSLKGQTNGVYILFLFGQLSFPRMAWSIENTVCAGC